MYEIEAEDQEVMVSLAFTPSSRDVPSRVVSDAAHYLWKMSVQKELNVSGWIEQMQGPVFDASIIIGIQYESPEAFADNYEKDRVIFNEAFEIELEESMERYFEQQLLLILHGDLEEHMLTTQSPVAEDELVSIEKQIHEVELQDF